MSVAINRTEFSVTLVLKNAEQPITIWFKSLAELNQAHTEWLGAGGVGKDAQQSE